MVLLLPICQQKLQKLDKAATARSSQRAPRPSDSLCTCRQNRLPEQRAWGHGPSHDSLFISSFISLLEEAGRKPAPCYALIFRGAEPVGAVAAQCDGLGWGMRKTQQQARQSASRAAGKNMLARKLLSWGSTAFFDRKRYTCFARSSEAIYRLRRVESSPEIRTS